MQPTRAILVAFIAGQWHTHNVGVSYFVTIET